jgi:excisionase family DNA binding protein
MDSYGSYEDIPVMMTVEEFGKLMRVSRNTAYAFVRSGLVPTVKVGRQIRIYRGDVLKLRDAQIPPETA